MLDGVIPYLSDKRCRCPGFRSVSARKARTFSSSNLDKRQSEPCFVGGLGLSPYPYEWAMFSLCVQYSRFSSRLSALFPFLWLVTQPSGQGPTQASITSLCTSLFFIPAYVFTHTFLYPWGWLACLSANGSKRWKLIICPHALAAYPMTDGIGRVSMKKGVPKNPYHTWWTTCY